MASEMYFYAWQNPVLRNSIYPFRETKLRDFLLIYKEVDLWAQNKGKSPSDPMIASRLGAIAIKAKARRTAVETALQAAIQERIASDTWFARITAPNEKNLRFKRIYYLDRVISDQTQRQADLLAQQKSLLKRVDWYKEGDPRRQTWRGRAAELDAPIIAIEQQLASIQKLRDLYEEQERLPDLDGQASLTVADLVRGDLDDYEDELQTKGHDELVALVWEKLKEKRIDGKPRFERWLQYMIIHFSGMRYISAHGSFADPNELLELLVREDEKGKLKPGEDFDDQVEARVQALLRTNINGVYKNYPPPVKALIQLKQEKAGSDDPLPDWVWQEATKFTQLRLGVNDPNWEAISPERYKFEDNRWRAIMDSWERQDITQWRQKHAQTLDLIVTRAVCNEIAEHIQHLRGNLPPGGLTSKPKWYLNLQGKTASLPQGDPKKCYFRRAGTAGDFVNGASIFWVGWVDKQPNAWQVALPLPGIDLTPGAPVVDGRTKDGPSWNVRSASGSFVRTRKPDVVIPSVVELRRRGMTDREIEQYRASLRSQGAVDKQYLRWKHEATVVDVVERLDGTYVLTFETGKIGLNWHTVDNLTGNPVDGIFVGYLPKTDVEPANLDAMLDEGKILRTEEAVSFDLIFGIPAGEEPGEGVPSYAFTDRRIRGYRIASVMLRTEKRLRKLRRRRRKARRKPAEEQAVASAAPTPLHAPLSERGESKEPLPTPPVQQPVDNVLKPKKPRRGG
jgi:hypothetical protein